ncbi:tRNA 4-thiouridine(8) synthase ThiI [Acidianus sulfidivorans JP7]|uniref:tRNA sulfurtransferase n=1 Tax=Acidianus sulfidivorans JP7 TaxID=619593 RepID=A0A2U9IKG5_9CREN|nr:tRNA uracil 4-sulfurtransferase ThiI [Acidianus sulfidivorans]AWR96424.1 tRNA 4-thiouridine(8) synthase ThiI [Acidianus sulfidivorans JP7]
MKVVIVRYAEIGIKSDRVRKKMENVLISNILYLVKKNGCKNSKVEKERGRIFFYGDTDCIKISASKVFGVKSVSEADEITFSSIDEIVNYAEKIWKDKINSKIFAVRVKRVGKHNFTSIDVAAKVGERLYQYGKVNLENPEITLFIEIRNNRAFFFDEVIEGPGGLPIGVEGKGIALVSGGIDSPVAAWMIMKRGVALDILHCNISGPLSLSSISLIFEKLKEWSAGYMPKIYIIDCGKLIYTIMKNIDRRLWSIAFKRGLYLLANEIAKKYGYKAIVTGESLGQVSSQTLSVLSSLEYKIDTLFLRPLIGFDKDEISKLAQKIGTLELSNKVPEYCAIFSHKPKTKASIKDIEYIDSKLDGVIQEILSQNETMNVDDKNIFIDTIPENSIVIDLRDEADYQKSHIPNSLRMDPKDVLDYIISKGDKNSTYVLYCYNGVMSGDLAYRLRKLGYKVYALSNKSIAKT